MSHNLCRLSPNLCRQSPNLCRLQAEALPGRKRLSEPGDIAIVQLT